MRSGLSIFRSTMGKTAAAAVGRVMPQDCLLCGAPAGNTLLCAECDGEFERLPAQRCPVCALPTSGATVCGACLKQPPHFAATVALYPYDFPVDRLIQALKYGNRLAIVPFLGETLAAAERIDADVMMPLPLHPIRLRQRGFNQALEIARVVARRWRMPLDFSVCERSLDAAPQAKLPWSARARNVRGSFLCRSDMTGKHVVVVDDVMTTGATLDEFARSLKKAGAARVTNLVAARTLKSS